jgi:hypothetical protein
MSLPLKRVVHMTESGYSIDLSAFSLAKLLNIIKNTRLLPSQQILLENIDERFACLEDNGIENLQQLQGVLKTKARVLSFAEKTGLPVDYLSILRREVNSYQPKPINLKDFPGVDPQAVHKMEHIGIKNTKQLFPHVLNPEDRGELGEQVQIDDKEVLELTKLTDVARLKYVGPKFARLLVESNYDTAEKVVHANYEELYLDLQRVNEESGIYKGGFGLDDMKVWVNVVVQDVPLVIEY